MDLSGVTVLDLTRLLPGPYATQLLADMGVDVVKVEDPDGGDYARSADPTAPNGQGAMFTSVNHGKKSVALDLKTDAGLEAFYHLVKDVDVVFEQFRPGVADRLGVGYDDVREHNPSVVYCSLSGYGQSGPYADRAGHDLNYAGFAGLLDMTRPSEDDPPTIPGYPIADMAGGVVAALSIAGALLSRTLGGSDGEYLDVSMTDAALSFSQPVAALAMYADGDDPRPGATELTGKFPCYGVYETADGKFVTVAALEPEFWRTLCEALDRPHLVDEHRAEDAATRKAVREELQAAFGSKPRAEWESALGDEDAMFGLVHTPGEALADPQVRSRGLVDRENADFPRITYPAIGDDTRKRLDLPPSLGEHTAEVLTAHGYSEADVERLASRGVVKTP